MQKIFLMLERIEQRLNQLLQGLKARVQSLGVQLGLLRLKKNISHQYQHWSLLLGKFKSQLAEQLSTHVGPKALSYYRHKLSLVLLEWRQLLQEFKLAIKNKPLSESIRRTFNQLKILSQRHLSPGRLALLGLLFLLMVLNLLYLIRSGEQLNEQVVEDQLAAVPLQQLRHVPDYYNQSAQSSLLKGLIIPVQLPQSHGPYEVILRDLRIDCYILFRTRTAKKYFDLNTLQFVDELLLRMKPVLPSYPLNAEGEHYLSQWLAEGIEVVLEDRAHIKDGVKEIFMIEKLAQ